MSQYPKTLIHLSRCVDICGRALISVDETMHLVLTFFATVSRQQCPLLPFCYFMSLLESGQATRHFCHAICAASVPFSRQSVRLIPFDGEAFASDARESLNSSHENTLQLKVQRILCLSVLSVYETYQGRGLQAWYDISEMSLQ